MKIVTGKQSLRIFAVATALSLALGLPSARQMAAADPDSIDQEDRVEKSNDLNRARTNRGISPDRIVVVYENPTAVNDPVRLRIRQQIGGRLLRADRTLQRDIVRVPGGRAEAIAHSLKNVAGVRDAYADPVATVALTPNDPMSGPTFEWGLATIQANAAWDTSQAQGIIVAVLDCGIRADHPDLLRPNQVSKVLRQENFSPSATTEDRCNHGTHVAGTIAATTNNGLGVAGVAPEADLLGGKVLDDTGIGLFSDIDRAIEWAADNGAQVINMSLSAAIDYCPAGTELAISYARSKGSVVVAAAGNSGVTGAGAPANCPNVIGVAATDVSDEKASFSQYGPGVDVAAPGVDILSTVNPELPANGGAAYARFNGTSMASPHAAGVLALIWATGHGTSPASVESRLFATADVIPGTGDSWTFGRVNAARAVSASSPDPALTVGFDDKTGQNQSLTGQYPTGAINWGTNAWYHSAPWGGFTSKSISFNAGGVTSRAFTFLTPRRLTEIQAYNGGSGPTTVSLTCAGQTTKTQSVPAGQIATIRTGWTGTCTTVTVGSSNGWDTNFDNLVHDVGTPPPPDTAAPTISNAAATAITASGATITWSTNEASDAQVEFGMSTSYGSSTALNSSPVTSHSQALVGLQANTTYHYRVKSRDAAGNLATSGDFTFTTLAASTSQSVTFDDKAGQNQPLNGQYPTGVIDWASNAWYHSAPWGAFTTRSISFNGVGVTSRNFKFVTPRRLVQLDAYNGGGSSTAVSLTCETQTKSVTVAARQKVSIVTGWTGTCTTVTVGSSNGWDTNFDSLVVASP